MTRFVPLRLMAMVAFGHDTRPDTTGFLARSKVPSPLNQLPVATAPPLDGNVVWHASTRPAAGCDEGGPPTGR